MKRYTILIIAFLFVSISFTYTQNGWIKGVVQDKEKSAGIPFAYIVFLQDSIIIKATSCSFEGCYTLKTIKPGVYDMKVSSDGFQTVLVKGIIFIDGWVNIFDIQMKPSTINFMEVEVIEYELPPIFYDSTTAGSNAKRINME